MTTVTKPKQVQLNICAQCGASLQLDAVRIEGGFSLNSESGRFESLCKTCFYRKYPQK